MSYSKAVLASYLYLPAKEIGDVEALRRELTIAPKYDGEPIEIYHETQNWFGMPLFHYQGNSIGEVIDKRIDAPVKIEFRGKLRPEQEALSYKFELAYEDGRTGFIIEAKPGFGKTVVAIFLISLLEQRTLVIVPRSNLIKQWRERLLRFSNLKPHEIGWVEGGKGDWVGKKVVIGLVHSLVLDRYGDSFRRSFGCVVFDEVDRSVPPQTFAPAVAMFPAKYRIGMSATLKRQDGMEIIFQKHLGQVYLRGGDEGRMKPRIIIRHYPISSGFVFPGSQKLNRRGMILSRLASNPARNAILLKDIAAIWKSGRKLLVLSDRKAQLQYLRMMLVKQWGVPDREIGYYVRSLGRRQFSHAERAKIASACKILLGTYGMIQLGTDIPDLAALVYGTPQSWVQQSQGRIERALEGKKQPIVVDLVDDAYGDCIKWAVARKRWYRTQGLEVVTI